MNKIVKLHKNPIKETMKLSRFLLKHYNTEDAISIAYSMYGIPKQVKL